ncbi:MAG: apolipoprotein N-acyltransferase [bacterium]|nr:apolipoprotein N-acyltransferase [bacterium]
MAFPKYDHSWLAWIGLLPLFIAMHRVRPGYALLSSFAAGLVFFSGIFNWTLSVPGYKFHHHAILIPYLALYFAVFGWLFSFLQRRCRPATAFLAAPFIWVCIEYLRTNFSFLALPWALLAHSQYQATTMIQFSALTGAYGFSFILVSVNSALALFLITSAERMGWHGSRFSSPLSLRTAMIAVLVAAFLSGAALLYGRNVVSSMNTTEKVKISVLQGNIDREKKRHPKKYKKFIMQRYTDLSRKVFKENPALIVWPEAATPGLVIKNQTLLNQITSLAKEANIHFLIGSSEYSKFAKEAVNRGKLGNTALFFSPKGKILGQYLKIHLVPFGEYLPYEDFIPWPDFIVSKDKNWDHAGKEITLFDINKENFGVIICWEIVFPDLFRQFVKNGADFMINITNEGWFGDTAAPYQMVAISVFRAVENRVSLTRSANTGVSCFIDPLGRITGRVHNAGKDIFVKGFLTQDVELSKEKTFYTLYGDIFVYICIVISFISIIAALVRGKSGSNL